MNDSGLRESNEYGATREPSDGRGRFDLISPFALERLAVWYELGAKKYGDRNWEKGLTRSRCVESLFRHLVKYMQGKSDEDHLAAIAWNAFAIMHFEEVPPIKKQED